MKYILLAALITLNSTLTFACEDLSNKAFVGFLPDVMSDVYRHYILTSYDGPKPTENAYVPVWAASPNTILDKTEYEIASKVSVQLNNATSRTDANGNLVANTSDGWYVTFKCTNP